LDKQSAIDRQKDWTSKV